MAWNRHGGVSWDWTPETWGWSPALGRWSPSYGGPKGCVRLDVSTEGVDATQAYEYWRETVFYYFAADRQPDDSQGFRAQANVLVSPRGEFRRYRSDAISGCRTERQVNADGGEDIDLGLVLAGERVHREGRWETASGPGEFFAYDSVKPSHVRWTAHMGLHLTLRRAEVVDQLGRDVPPSAELTRALHRSPLSRFFRHQLELFARQLDTLGVAQRQILLDHTLSLALILLQQAFGSRKLGERSSAYLYDAATQFIVRHLDDPDLDATRVAVALGCSRATLYRAFADRSMTVYSFIRELRLQRAKDLLEIPNSGMTVAEIAESVGFTNPSNFGRSFRQRFGQSPGHHAKVTSQPPGQSPQSRDEL